MTFHQFLVQSTQVMCISVRYKFGVSDNGNPFCVTGMLHDTVCPAYADTIVEVCLDFWKQLICWPTEQGYYNDGSYELTDEVWNISNASDEHRCQPWDFGHTFRFVQDV